MTSDAPSYVRASDVFVEEIDGELLLLKEGTPDVVHLDAVASAVWRLMAEPATVDVLVQELAAAYGVAQDRVAQDVQPLLEVLRGRGLVTEAV